MNKGQRLNLVEDIQELEDIIEDQYKLLLKVQKQSGVLRQVLTNKISADMLILIQIMEYKAESINL